MNNFEIILGRIANMMAYELSLSEIHDRLVAEGVDEQTIFFAYKAAQTEVRS